MKKPNHYSVTGMNWGAHYENELCALQIEAITEPTSYNAKNYVMCSFREAKARDSLQFSGFLFKLLEPVGCFLKGHGRGKLVAAACSFFTTSNSNVISFPRRI